MGKVVLVHGAWHGAWCWDDVLAELHERGVEAGAIELPLTSHRDNVEVAAAAIAAAGPDAVVCGHSYDGCVISSAAKVANVGRLVYLCALMLDEGEEPFALSEGYEVELTTALVIDEAAGTLSVDAARAGEVFDGDSPAHVADARPPGFARCRSRTTGASPTNRRGPRHRPPTWCASGTRRSLPRCNARVEPSHRRGGADHRRIAWTAILLWSVGHGSLAVPHSARRRRRPRGALRRLRRHGLGPASLGLYN
jgi:hypothetical protein